MSLLIYYIIQNDKIIRTFKSDNFIYNNELNIDGISYKILNIERENYNIKIFVA